MINLDFSTLIDRPIKDVFAFVANPNSMSKWNSAVVSIQQVTPGEIGVGTKFKTVGEAMGGRLEGEMQLQAGPMQMNMNLLFKTVDTGTKLSLNVQGNPAGIFKLAEGVMTGQIKSLMEANFTSLKSVLESGA